MRDPGPVIRPAVLAAVTALACAGDRLTEPPPTLVVSPTAVTITVDDTIRLRAVVLGPRGDTLQGVPLTFASADTSVARVDSTGLVTAIDYGDVLVVIASGDATGAAAIHVARNGYLRVSPDSAFLQEGDTVALAWVVRDSLGAIVDPAPVRFRPLDSAVVRVSGGGRVTFAGRAGTVGVEVNSAGRRDTTVITAVVARVDHYWDGYSCCVAIGTLGRVWVMTDGWLLSLDLSGPYGPYFAGAWYYHRNASDMKMNGARTRAFITDPYFGWVVALDPAESAAGVDSFPVGGASSVLVAPGDSVIYVSGSTSSGGQVYGLRVTGGARIDSLPVSACDLVARQHLLYTAGCLTRLTSVVEYDMTARVVRRTLELPRAPWRLLVSADGSELYAGAEGWLYFVSLVTGAVADSIRLADQYAFVSGLALQPGTGLLWVSVSRQGITHPGEKGHLLVIAPAERRVVRWVFVRGNPQRLAFTASGMGVVPNDGYWVDLVR